MTLDDFRKSTKQGSWKSHAKLLLNESKPSVETTAEFGTYWIEAGHHIREQVADDRILVRLLRHMLPPYEGGAITLFRGENLGRWEDRVVGLAWASNIDVARMFGRGLNSIISGGVLLTGYFESAAIISGSNAHSRYLGEEQFTIDPFYGTNILAIENFPPIS